MSICHAAFKAIHTGKQVHAYMPMQEYKSCFWPSYTGPILVIVHENPDFTCCDVTPLCGKMVECFQQ